MSKNKLQKLEFVWICNDSLAIYKKNKGTYLAELIFVKNDLYFNNNK